MGEYPVPIPGLVIRYGSLWRREAERGAVEGQKHRPCAIVLAVQREEGELVVTVAPITREKPKDPEQAIALSAATRRRLGLGTQPNWIMATEVNTFYWPGPDLRVTASGEYAYGELPAVVFAALVKKVLAAGRRAAATPREG